MYMKIHARIWGCKYTQEKIGRVKYLSEKEMLLLERSEVKILLDKGSNNNK